MSHRIHIGVAFAIIVSSLMRHRIDLHTAGFLIGRMPGMTMVMGRVEVCRAVRDSRPNVALLAQQHSRSRKAVRRQCNGNEAGDQYSNESTHADDDLFQFGNTVDAD